MDKWIVLDRDGVINFDSDDYIKNADEWKPIPGSIEAIAKLSKAGYSIAIATNQSGISRGLFDLDDLEAMHEKLTSLVEDEGGRISGIFYCPHLPDDDCHCRKPKTGLLDEIEIQFGTKLDGAPFIGDSEKDLQAATTKGCTPILVKTGKGTATLAKVSDKPEYKGLRVFNNLADFANAFIESEHK